jgi:hypothetical protein
MNYFKEVFYLAFLATAFLLVSCGKEDPSTIKTSLSVVKPQGSDVGSAD